MARGFSGVRPSLEARPFPSNAGGLASEGCILDGSFLDPCRVCGMESPD